MVRPHGIRGEVAVEVRTDDPGRRFAVGSVMGTDPPEAGPLTVASTRWHSGRLLVTFTGIADRTGAEPLRGVWLTVDADQVGSPEDPDEFHDHQLVGLRVVSIGGDDLGTVARIDHAPASDLIVLDKPGGGTALIPFVSQLVPTVDVAGGRIVVDLPDGLLDL